MENENVAVVETKKKKTPFAVATIFFVLCTGFVILYSIFGFMFIGNLNEQLAQAAEETSSSDSLSLGLGAFFEILFQVFSGVGVLVFFVLSLVMNIVNIKAKNCINKKVSIVFLCITIGYFVYAGALFLFEIVFSNKING